MKSLRVILTGGGTAGHIWPLLELANELKLKGAKLFYLGSGAELENRLIGRTIPSRSIVSGKLRRYFALSNVLDFFRLAVGLSQAYRLISWFKPNVVFSKGGFVSLPVTLAAGLKGIPIVVHESDTLVGLANRLVLKFARTLCLGWPRSVYSSFPAGLKLVFTGNPARGLPTISPSKARVQFNLSSVSPVVLIIGGSQGARVLNEFVLDNLEILLAKTQVIHICGQKNYPSVSYAFSRLGVKAQKRYRAAPFLTTKYPFALAAADLVLARSGAGTLADLAQVGLPSILVPLTGSAGDHQKLNAQHYRLAGAAVVIDESELGPSTVDLIFELINDRARLDQMSLAAGKLSSPQAVGQIVQEIIEAAGSSDQ